MGRFLPNLKSCLVRCLLAIHVVSRFVWKVGGDLLSCRDILNQLSMPCNTLQFCSCLILKIIFSKSKLVKVKVLFETFGCTR